MSKAKHSESELVELIHNYNIDPTQNIIYLFGDEAYVDPEVGTEPGVEYIMANTLVRNITYLASRNSNPIVIHMKTCGGDWKEGMAIYDAIKNCPNKVIVISYTHARSMSSLILQAADLRVVMPYSTFMFHYGTNGIDGTSTLFQTEAEQDRISKDQMLSIYIESMRESKEFQGWSTKKLRSWLVRKIERKEDVHLNAKDAVKYGFADLIIGEEDLTAFNVQDYLE